jgi:hypothetical protein
MFPRWKYILFQSWFRRTLAFQKPLAFFSNIINCFTNIFDSKQLKYSPKVYIFALRRENGNSRRNEPLFLVSVDKLPTCYSGKHAHTCLKPTVQGNCTFKRTKESFEEWEIQSKFNIFDENEQEKSFFLKRLQF